MKKIMLPTVIMILALVASAGYSQTFKTIDYTTATPTETVKSLDPRDTSTNLVVDSTTNVGFITMATYTFDVSSTSVLSLNDVFSATNIGGSLVEGFKFKVYGGDCILGPNNVATGTFYNGEYVASGTIFPGWTGLKKSSAPNYNLKIAPLANIKVVFWAW